MATGQGPSACGRRASARRFLGRSVGVMAALATLVALAAGVLALIDAPVQAQVPPLPPVTLPPPDPSTTTTTTTTPLALPVVPTEDLLPPSNPSTPPASILAPPTTAPARHTTLYNPPPVPPSTPRVASTPTKDRAKYAAPRAAPADRLDRTGSGEVDTGYGDLPFDTKSARHSAGHDTMELGVEASARNQVGTLASFAAGLIALVLFGVAMWLRSESRRPTSRPCS